MPDRFHMIQHLNKGFNAVRIRVMKHLDQTNAAQAKLYRQLKSLYKLLLKSADKLDYVTFKKGRNFGWSYLTDAEVVDRLLLISSELKTAYHYYQQLFAAYHAKDADQFFNLLKDAPNELPGELKHIKKAFFKYESGIPLSLYHTVFQWSFREPAYAY